MDQRPSVTILTLIPYEKSRFQNWDLPQLSAYPLKGASSHPLQDELWTFS